MGVAPARLEVALGPDDKAAEPLMEPIESFEIEVAPIHNHVRAGFQGEQIEDADVVHFAMRDMDKDGNGPLQIEQRVQLDRPLGAAKVRPRKQRQTQVDGGGVQRIDRRVQIETQIGVGLQGAGNRNQPLRQIGVDAPVAALVGIGQRGAFDCAAKAGVIEPASLRTQAYLDVAQALAIGQLRKGHGQKLVPARQTAHPAVAVVALHAPAELVVRDQAHELREHRLPLIHPRPSSLVLGGRYGGATAKRNSNRKNSNYARFRKLIDCWIDLVTDLSDLELEASHPGPKAAKRA
jgi:hypothetical protein